MTNSDIRGRQRARGIEKQKVRKAERVCCLGENENSLVGTSGVGPDSY